MNIFEIYLKKIKIIINDLNDKDLLKIPDKLSSITVDTTPANFKSDISTNVAMVLSKPNKKTPIEIGEIIKKKILEDADVSDVEIVKPGFLNITLKPTLWNKLLETIVKKPNEFGLNKNSEKKNFIIEFVSANPTGPLHVGHCRGEIGRAHV